MEINYKKIRNDYFLLSQKNNETMPIYFDNACTTLRPDVVIEASSQYYFKHPSCHNRAVHKLGRMTSTEFGLARAKVKNFLNAKHVDEIIFTKNATEGLNILANGISWTEGDIVLTTNLEHNSNLLPWQVLVAEKGIRHQRCDISPNDDVFDLENYKKKFINNKIKLVSVFYTSNVTGMVLPIKEMVKIAHENGALFALDAAQAITSYDIDVQDLDVDFLVFSFHKAFGPSGFGVLYGKHELLVQLKPLLFGGETVVDSTYESLLLSELPNRLEAGLQNYSAAISGGVALEYIKKIGTKNILSNQLKLNGMISDFLVKNQKVKILGPRDYKLRPSLVNFLILGKDMGEISIVLDETKNIMVRSGVHCCHAWYNFYKLPPSLRVSFSLYNTPAEASVFIETIENIIRFF